jgi:GT2 family glycosyltransferase
MTVELSPAQSATVAVILVNWNGWRDAIECASSLLMQTHSNLHIFLVDNDSRDESIENICTWCTAPRSEVQWRKHDGVARITDDGSTAPISFRVVSGSEKALDPAPTDCRLTLIRSGGNLGFAGGCNVGIRAAGIDVFDFFWFLNTDTVVRQDALAALLERAQRGSRIGIVGSTIRYYDRPDIIQVLGGARMDPATVITRLIGDGLQLDDLRVDAADVERDMFYVTGASMLVSRAFVRDVGLMQEDYFLYYEEIDWAMRARGRFALAFAPDSHVFHKSGASSSKVLPAFTANLYYRNRIRFANRFFPERLRTVQRGLIVEFLRHVLRGRWTHARIVAAALRDCGKIVSEMKTQTDAKLAGQP